MAIHDQMPWFPAWGMKIKDEILDKNEILESFSKNKPDKNWMLLAFDAAASEKHLWTAWYSMKRNEKNSKMIAKSLDAEFIRLIAGTHQVKIAFNNAGIRAGDNCIWIIRLPEIEIGNDISDLLINRDSYNNYDYEANQLIEKMNGKLMTERPVPTMEGLSRIGYDIEKKIINSLEDCFILHLVSSKI